MNTTYLQLAKITENMRTFIPVKSVVLIIVLCIALFTFIGLFGESTLKKFAIKINYSQLVRQFHTEIDSQEKGSQTLGLHKSIHIQPIVHNDLTNALEQPKKSDNVSMDDVLELIRSTNKNVIRLSVASGKTDKSTDKMQDISNHDSTTNQHKNELNKTNLKPLAPFIPNVVHYVWFGANWNFTFLQYLSFLSVSRYLNPDYIFIHGDNSPADGVWWNRTRVDIPNIFFVRITKRTAAPSGQPFKHIEHAADVERIVIMQKYGGIYLDTDMLMVKSVDYLRYNYPMVMGRENPGQISCGIILARRGEPFLSMWLECYRSYMGQKEGWAVKSTMVPHQLATIYPHLIHVEERSLTHPNWVEPEVKQLFEGHYNWSSNYAVHVWKRAKISKIPQNPAEIDNLNTTLGEVSRHIYYGSQKLRKDLPGSFNNYSPSEDRKTRE